MNRSLLIAVGGTAIGTLLGGAVGGAIWAVDVNRRPPRIYDLQIVGETHAGGDLRVREHFDVPENCMPRVARKLVGPPDELSDGRPVTQIVTDAAVLADGDILIPLSRSVPPGPWRYEETISTEGCGVLSGVLPPQIGNARAPDTNGRHEPPGVPVMILPQRPLPTVSAQ